MVLKDFPLGQVNKSTETLPLVNTFQLTHSDVTFDMFKGHQTIWTKTGCVLRCETN